MGAAPLWSGDGLERPALLRLVGDRFMEALRATLANDPSALGRHVARPESFASPPYDRVPDELKLFQPVHGRTELAVASLVCVLPGLPDHHVAPATDEVGFVVRRLDGEQEYAWIASPDTPNRGRWVAVGGEELGAWDTLSEQVLPAFPLHYSDGARRRQLWAGVIPTAAQDAWSDEALAERARRDRTLPSRWVSELNSRFLDPMEELFAREAQDASLAGPIAMALLDLWTLLDRDLPDIAARLDEGRAATGHVLIDALQSLSLTVTETQADPLPLWEALAQVRNHREALLGLSEDRFEPSWALPSLDDDGVSSAWRRLTVALVVAGPPGAPPAASERARYDATTRYHVRFVYRTPPCPHRRPLVLSRTPSERFRVAAVYDPDAPARPVRIELPESVDALRRAPKNVSFVASAAAKKQMSAVADDPVATLKGEPGAGSDDGLGFICSLSLPTITLCASLVLNLFLVLFNLAFFWLPFIRLCLPVPKSVSSKVPA